MNGTSFREEKALLRRSVRSRLNRMTAGETAEQSLAVSERILRLTQWKRARLVLAYLPFGGEFDPSLLLNQAIVQGKELGLPRLKNRTTSPGLDRNMEFYRVSSLDGPWDNHPYGLREPFPDLPLILPENYTSGEILVLTPGLAFDGRCFRLGRGGGYYDTYINRFRGRLTLAAPAFSCQIVENVPAEPHDRPVDLVVFPEGVLSP